MSDSTTTPNPNDQLFADFIRDLEQHGDAIIAEYINRHPHLATDFRELAALQPPRPAAPPPPIPERLGEFEIVRKMEHGGMGEIYEAKHERLDRRIVVKTIRRGYVTPDARRRFQREQRVLAKLHQSNIIPIYDAGEQDQIQYYAMPYIDGVNLRHVVQTVAHTHSTWASGRTPNLPELVDLAKKESEANADQQKTKDQPTTDFPSKQTKFMKVRLDAEYFRSVAKVMADIAEAVHHVHEEGFLHRDLKPSNIMLDADGTPQVIDFGLARPLGTDDSSETGAEQDLQSEEPLTQQGVIPFTPPYAAPEQWREESLDARTDVWALGVTLYELLTLHPAFTAKSRDELEEKILTVEPPTPKSYVKRVSQDLVAICVKAMAKKPARRYWSSLALCHDLRRWLQSEPTTARRPWPPRRLWLWMRRNPGWAATVFVLLFFVLCGVAIGATLVNQRREVERERTVQKLIALRLSQHHTTETERWSDNAWELVRQAARIRTSSELQAQAAATLIGMDARATKKFKHVASSLAFDAQGKRLVMGGWDKQPAAVWNGSYTDGPKRCSHPGAGVVTFRGDQPLQLMTGKNGKQLVLLNVDTDKVKCRFPQPPLAQLPPSDVVLALGKEAKLAASVLKIPAKKLGKQKKHEDYIVVWDGMTGDLLHKIPFAANSLTFSPDNKFLAAADKTGIVVWSLAKGKLTTVAKLNTDGRTIHALSFGRQPRIFLAPQKNKNAHLQDWQLASGDDSGTVVVWNLRTQYPVCFCRGSRIAIYSIKFHPDGMTLASIARGETRLWDATTGQMLLKMATGNYMTGLVFSPDGKILVTANRPELTSDGRTVCGEATLWTLQNGRGIRLLTGLNSRVNRLVFPPNGHLLAVLCHDWKVGVWDLTAGHLLYVRDVPRGLYIDNASLIFDPKGKMLCYSAGHRYSGHALVWNARKGRKLQEWKLQPGLQNHLIHHKSGKLLLFQVETKDGREFPLFGPGIQPQDRVCRVYELTPDGTVRHLWEKLDFKTHVYLAAAAPDGSLFVVDGKKEKQRLLKAFDTLTGAELKTLNSEFFKNTTGPVFHSAENQLTVNTLVGKNYLTHMIELPSGRLLFTVHNAGLHSIGPAKNLICRLPWDPPFYCEVYRGSSRRPFLRVAASAHQTLLCAKFNHTATHLAWSDESGAIYICDLEATEKKLASVGMGW